MAGICREQALLQGPTPSASLSQERLLALYPNTTADVDKPLKSCLDYPHFSQASPCPFSPTNQTTILKIPPPCTSLSEGIHWMKGPAKAPHLFPNYS